MKVSKPHTATYFEVSSTDKFGEKTFGAGTDISVRWLDKSSMVRNDQGEEQVTRSIVFSDSQQFVIGNKLALGASQPESSARIIVSVESSKGIHSSSKTLYKAYLL